MLTFSKRGRCLVVLFAIAVLVATGCRRSRKSSTVFSSDDDIFTTGDFPGAPVQDGNVADDGRAMSPSGEDVKNIRCTINGGRGTAMLTYKTDPAGSSAPVHIYAHYFDGTRWTPPVVLASADATPAAFALEPPIVHAFINTADHASELARDRDGDAVIFWYADDADGDGAGTADSVNAGLFATYFDATFKDDPSRSYGFQTMAVRVDSEDAAAEDLIEHGIVTDGLCGDSTFASRNSIYQYGDSTTGLVAAWLQAVDNEPGLAGAEDVVLFYAAYDLAQTGPADVPLSPGVATRLPILGFGASDSRPPDIAPRFSL